MRRTQDPRRWQAWRRSGAVKRPSFSSVELQIGPPEQGAPHIAISYHASDHAICAGYNRAIRELMLAKKMNPLHLDAAANGDPNTPGTHVWVMQSKDSTESDLHELLREIHPLARSYFFEAWVHSPPAF